MPAWSMLARLASCATKPGGNGTRSTRRAPPRAARATHQGRARDIGGTFETHCTGRARVRFRNALRCPTRPSGGTARWFVSTLLRGVWRMGCVRLWRQSADRQAGPLVLCRTSAARCVMSLNYELSIPKPTRHPPGLRSLGYHRPMELRAWASLGYAHAAPCPTATCRQDHLRSIGVVQVLRRRHHLITTRARDGMSDTHCEQ